jgi:hypothetical protein
MASIVSFYPSSLGNINKETFDSYDNILLKGLLLVHI